jgi:hypothetical protein
VHGQDGAVAGVIAASTAAGSMGVTGSTSTSRVGPQVARHLHRGGEGQRGRDHLVGPDADGLQRQVQAGGGGVDGDGLATTQVVANSCSKALVSGPVVTQPERSVRAASISASPMSGRAKAGNPVDSWSYRPPAPVDNAGSYRFISV